MIVSLFGSGGRRSGGADGISGGGSGGGFDGGMGRDTAIAALIRAYWQSLRYGDRLPDRAEIDPRGMGAALEHAFLIERIASGHARLRIAGMALSDLMGMEVRGMPLSSFFLSPSRSLLQDRLEAMFEMPAILSLELVSERGLGRAELPAQMIVLPILGTSGKIDMALGALVAGGERGRPPRRFNITRAKLEPIEAEAVLIAAEPPDPMPASRIKPVPAPAVPQAQSAKTSVPYLRLVKG